MRILMALAFAVLSSTVQAATVVEERDFGLGPLYDRDVEECDSTDCYGSRFAEPNNHEYFLLDFLVPVGMRLARARLDYTLTFQGLGDFDDIRFWTNIEVAGPGPSYFGDGPSPDVTSKSPTAVVKNSFRFPVSKSTFPHFHTLYISFWTSVELRVQQVEHLQLVQ